MTAQVHRDARFWNRIAPRYARSAIADEAAYARKLAETAALLRPDMQVLELGCGTGSTALHHAPRVAHLRATDLSEGMLAIARDKAARAGIGNLSFERAAAEEIDQAPGSLDMVMAHSLLHLVRDPAALTRRMAGWLKPGGHLVTSTACLSDGMGLLRLVTLPGHALGLLPRVTYLSRQELRAMTEAAGLQIRQDWRPGPRKAVFMIAEKVG
jgi:ubiquinone/menaquinone biosynthesis C-methylase UbiE